MIYLTKDTSGQHKTITIDGTKKDYISKTIAFLDSMKKGDIVTAFDSYNRTVSVWCNYNGFAVYTVGDIVAKRTAAKETARRLYELDINNRIGY